MSNANEYGQAAGALSRAANMVSEAKSDFTTISSRLSDQIAGIQGKWGGAGATAFFSLHQAWTEKQHTIISALDEFANSLTSTEKDNTNTDDEQHSSMGNLKSRLN